MGTEKRRKNHSVTQQLFDQPQQFSFFQATRLLQGLLRVWQKNGSPKSIGRDVLPEWESVRFASFPSLRFPGSEISSIKQHDAIIKNDNQDIAELAVTFMGLTGQSSVLPVCFTELQLSRLKEKDSALTHFFDLINHRSVSLFYRAWEKYQLPIRYERCQLDRDQEVDDFSSAFLSLIGFQGDAIQSRVPVNDEELMYFAGLFSSDKRSANSLEACLSEYMDIPITINQFCGEWMTLSEDDQMQLPVFPFEGKNNCLGVDSVIGDEVYTVEGKFQIEIGPLNRSQFEQLLPGSPRLNALSRFTRMFVGGNYDFELKYNLMPEAISSWHLRHGEQSNTRLGWNSWLSSENNAQAKRSIIVDIN